jgi:hypothetical protein
LFALFVAYICTFVVLYFAVHVVSKDVSLSSLMLRAERSKMLKPQSQIKQFYYAPFFLGVLLGLWVATDLWPVSEDVFTTPAISAVAFSVLMWTVLKLFYREWPIRSSAAAHHLQLHVVRCVFDSTCGFIPVCIFPWLNYAESTPPGLCPVARGALCFRQYLWLHSSLHLSLVKLCRVNSTGALWFATAVPTLFLACFFDKKQQTT